MTDEIINKNKHLDSISEEDAAWHARILAAAGDAAALMTLAQDAPSVPLKVAALEAIKDEATLRQAMHDLRDHDKRLYRAAKAGWESVSGARVAVIEAAQVIANARALLAQEVVPVNRTVELDQAWAGINRELLEETVVTEFTTLSQQLAERARAQGERAQGITRWLNAVDAASAAVNAQLPMVATGDAPPGTLDTLAVVLLDLTLAPPQQDNKRIAARNEDAQRLLALAASVGERATFLHALPAPDAAEEPLERQLIEQWRGIPEMSEGALHSALAQRFADWRNAVSGERQGHREAHSAEQREQHRGRVKNIEGLVHAAEAAQVAGHVADLNKQVHAIDEAMKHGAMHTVHAALAHRIEALKHEQKRLADWQRWSGAQGREKLANEAQALADAAKEKVSLKAHADAINKLRERWKELDKTGAPSQQSVWHTFNSALESAYVPVAAHLDKLKAQRDENLAAREKIVLALAESAARFFPAQEGAPTTPAVATVDWRAVSHTLEEQHVAWRKLGPVEHTVPRKALKGEAAITTRYTAAVQALEAPLRAAQGGAQETRKKLIAKAKELTAGDALARDVIDKVRKLQGEWQIAAKAMPLQRRDENALWGEFKTATDSIFTARDAARTAADTEQTAKVKEREAVIDKLHALRSVETAADIKRAMSAAETEWRAAPEAPRQQAPKLDARYRAARDAASKRIGELSMQAEQVRYDALLAKLALCDEREHLFGEGAPDMAQAADLEDRWNAVAHFPDAWKKKLDARFAGLAVQDKNTRGIADTLLDLEMALGVDSPAAFTAERQMQKIRALKTAMEGRQAVTIAPADIERWLIDAAATPNPDTLSRERLQKIVAVVRRRKN